MTDHKVTITEIPRMLVGSNDIIFEIREGKSKLGDLRVSQGNLFWLPGVNRKYGYALDWAKFAQIVEEEGTRKRYTR